MLKRTYAIIAASGHIGSRVADTLLDAGHTVRVLTRQRARLAALERRGAQVVTGDVLEPGVVETLFRGSDAAFLIAPPNATAERFQPYFETVGTIYADAARATNLRHAVFISCLGAHDPRFRGLVGVHADVEKILDGVRSLNVVHLRAPSFFENLYYFMHAMRASGALVSPIAPTAEIETVATRDIATAASRLLLELAFEGHSSAEIHGPTELTMERIAALIGQALGRPFPAERVPREVDIANLVGAGLSRDFATLLNDTWDLFSTYGLLRESAPSPASRGTTTMESFVREQIVPAITAA